MIEKLKWDEQPEDAAKEVQNLIDHLVDAVNAIQKEREAERFEIQEWIGILEAVRKSVNNLKTMAKNTNTVLESLVEENNVHEKQIDELQMKLEPEKCEQPADQFAEKQEEWKDIKGYENLYQVSNLGNIRRVSNKIKKTRLNNWGYIIIDLWKENKSTTKAVHRIVAETFLPNPDNKAEVNHIDGNKTNNSINNLEWVTREENIQHAYDTGLNPKSLPMPEVVKMPKIICCETGDVFNSITEASHKYNVSISHLSSCLNGKDNRKTVGGWHWLYWLYCYCEPVKPDDDIIYKGGK